MKPPNESEGLKGCKHMFTNGSVSIECRNCGLDYTCYQHDRIEALEETIASLKVDYEIERKNIDNQKVLIKSLEDRNRRLVEAIKTHLQCLGCKAHENVLEEAIEASKEG